MKKTMVAIFASALIILSTQAQEAVVSGGGYHSGGIKTISWTLGEIAIETMVAGGIVLTQGFQQPIITVVSVEEIQGTGVQVTVFPNPTNDLLNISVHGDIPSEAVFSLYGIAGNLVANGKLENQSQLDFRSFQAGIYFLRISNKGQEIKSFKILKN